jgi:GT2 family glycosyltransferase
MGNGRPRVSAVIVTHNACARLARTVASVKAAGNFAEILVVDSGSRDDSLRATLSLHPDLKPHVYDGNVGPCVTRNRGLREAISPWVLLVDDDMELQPGLLEGLCDALVAEDVVAVGPAITYASQPDIVQYAGASWHYAGMPSFPDMGLPWRPAPPREVDILTSSCLLIKREPALEAGGFLPLMGFLMEDAEFTLRLRLRGWRLLCLPAFRATNEGGSVGLSIRANAFSSKRLHLQSRNRSLVRWLHYSPRTLLFGWPAFACLEIAGLLMSCVALRPWTFFSGKWSAWVAWKEASRLRREFRRARVATDAEVLACPALMLTGAARRAGAGAWARRSLDALFRGWWTLIRRGIP